MVPGNRLYLGETCASLPLMVGTRSLVERLGLGSPLSHPTKGSAGKMGCVYFASSLRIG